MRELLQETLEISVHEWETLAAKAHYQLAQAQEPRVSREEQPGAITAPE